MTERQYSLQEIRQMRCLIENDFLYGSFRPHHEAGITYVSRSFTEQEKSAVIEEQLRSYMAAGLGPDDLVDDLRGGTNVAVLDC